MSQKHEPEKPITLRQLYPGLNDEQLQAVEHAFKQYALLVWRICKRREQERQRPFDPSI